MQTHLLPICAVKIQQLLVPTIINSLKTQQDQQYQQIPILLQISSNILLVFNIALPRVLLIYLLFGCYFFGQDIDFLF